MRRRFGRRVDAVQNLRRGRLLHLLEDVRGPVEQVLALLPLALLLLEFALGFGPSLADLLELVGFLLGNLLERIRALALVLLDEGDLVLRAALFRGGVAHGLVKPGLGEALERVEVAALLVILTLFIATHEVLDGWVALDAHALAGALTVRGAVHIDDEDGRVVGIVSSQLVPIRLHRLAVASPRREELDEGGLAALENLGVEVGGGEIDGAGVSAEHQAHEGDREERDTHLDQDRKRACTI
mmetsp:Transcript_8023/g.35479  ORF Transcript_8023/g.35479 Transcript_8023/m.35479 type:complete len:242 (+) Transcript_8023:220-945(+)